MIAYNKLNQIKSQLCQLQMIDDRETNEQEENKCYALSHSSENLAADHQSVSEIQNSA